MNGQHWEQQQGILGTGHAEGFLMALYEKWRECDRSQMELTANCSTLSYLKTFVWLPRGRGQILAGRQVLIGTKSITQSKLCAKMLMAVFKKECQRNRVSGVQRSFLMHEEEEEEGRTGRKREEVRSRISPGVSAPSRSLERGSRVILARCLAGNQPSGPLREEGGGDISLLGMRPLYFSDIQQEQHSHHL
ncbi:unnamed protein product [Pleuronectes platessa]|uniref:Uncharacterized protein n=1 Tax=Pleuronectes platessa TaxID=8262 RepID=A0A9N7TKC0_PLEPL|nr:unnamed protein product [Pleuronectes platessa]